MLVGSMLPPLTLLLPAEGEMASLLDKIAQADARAASPPPQLASHSSSHSLASVTGSTNHREPRKVAKSCRNLESTDVATLTIALEYLITASQEDAIFAKAVNTSLRQCDLLEGRRPYEGMTQLLCHPDKEIVKLVMGLISVLVPSLSQDHLETLYAVLEKTNFQDNFKFLLKQRKDDVNMILYQFQENYTNHLRTELNTTLDPWNQRHEEHAKKFATCAEPVQAAAVLLVTELSSNLSLLGTKSLAYFGEVYGDFFRRVLDENEGVAEEHYPIDIVVAQVLRMLLEIVSDNRKEGKGFVGQQADAIVPLLFSNMNAFYELFCCAFALFDICWKEMDGTLLLIPKVLDEVKSRISPMILKQQSIKAVKDSLNLHRLLLQTSLTKSVTKKNLALDSREVAGDFAELLMNIVKLVNRITYATGTLNAGGSSTQLPPPPHIGNRKGSADSFAGSSSSFKLHSTDRRTSGSTSGSGGSSSLLATEDHETILDAIRAMVTLGKSATFPWGYVQPDFIAFIISCIAFRHWIRHPELSQEATKYLEVVLDKDPDGCNKMFTALKSLGQEKKDNNYRPLLKMIRNNKTFPGTLRIINKLFESLSSDAKKRKFISQLALVDALTILKSKVWSTANLRQELFRFQVNLLSLRADETFDYAKDSHRNILSAIWHGTFPNLALHNLGASQFELLGFTKFRCIEDFKGCKVQALSHLHYFTIKYPDIFQHLVLYTGDPNEQVLSVGDVGLALTDMLSDRLTKRTVILPVLFDEGPNSFSEVYCLVYLWLIQDWRQRDYDPIVATPAGGAQLFDVAEKNKSTTVEELFNHLGINMGVLRSPWFRSRSKSLSNASAAAAPPMSPGGAIDASTVNMAKLTKLLGKEVGKEIIQATDEEDDTPDLVTLYIAEHSEEMLLREKEVTKKLQEKDPAKTPSRSKRKKPAGTLRPTSSNEEIFADLLKAASTNKKKVDSLTGQRLDQALKSYGIEGSQENAQFKELVKRRKNELKEQKDFHKNGYSKHKAQQKKLLDDLKSGT